MEVIIIAGVAKNGVIGKNGALPWSYPEDLLHFRRTTSGFPVIMGRKTFESILHTLGKPLPNRKNVVVTRQNDYAIPAGVIVYQSVEEALQNLKNEDIMVAGGGEIFGQTIAQADMLYITEVHKKVEGDVIFPPIDTTHFTEIKREEKEGFAFVTYGRR